MPDRSAPRAIVIGGGPAGLMAAETLARGGVRVTVYDRMPTLGRKFLMAGRGGLNLTHSEEFAAFLERYHPREGQLHRAIEAFTPEDLRRWCEELGQETFIGSSGRVFPRSMKASPLLRAWLRRLAELGVEFRTRHRWQGWTGTGELAFTTPDGQATAQGDAVILALGGASWANLGSDGAWADDMAEAGIEIAPLRPSNCGFLASWSETFRERFAGQPLKDIGPGFGGKSLRGEALITADGIEGGGIYALSPHLREAIAVDGEAVLLVDLRPSVSHDELTQRLSRPRGGQSFSNFLRKSAKLSPVAIGLLRETSEDRGAQFNVMAADALATRIKAIPLRLTGTAPIARAISTAGGVSFAAIEANYMLKRKPGVFVAGEMLDWEAPTGGYLLQACFATGAASGRGALDWLRQSTS
ncbi:MAG: NAD(P)/FAD-dependent oxidoreductase [Rhodomicrobiaceae bacterium]